MAEKSSSFKGIKDIFYETRVLMGRGMTLKRFAREVLGGAVEPVMLNYIERGKRFPTEPQVRKLAAVRKQDPKELLVLLWQDRILHAISRELRRAIEAPVSTGDTGIAEGDTAFVLTRAVAALPDNKRWITVSGWARQVKKAFSDVGKKASASSIRQVTETLREQGLIEKKGGRVRRTGRHYVAGTPEEIRSLAMEFCGIFAKGLLEKIVRQEMKTYVRNHYLHIPESKIQVFHRRMDAAVRKVVEEFAVDEADAGKFLNVLMTSTPL